MAAKHVLPLQSSPTVSPQCTHTSKCTAQCVTASTATTKLSSRLTQIFEFRPSCRGSTTAKRLVTFSRHKGFNPPRNTAQPSLVSLHRNRTNSILAEHVLFRRNHRLLLALRVSNLPVHRMPLVRKKASQAPLHVSHELRACRTAFGSATLSVIYKKK